MPRSPTVFNLVPGTVPQVPDTPISSAMFNAAMLDFEQTFNTPQPIQYGGTAATTAIGGFDGLNTKGANVATAATLNLDTATGAFVDLTGTTTVTAVTLSDGRHRMARATGAFQITVGASLIGNAGGSNINVEVGDLIIFEGYSAGVVRFWVVRASGQSIAGTPGYIYGLTLANNSTDAVNDIDIATGSAASDDPIPTLINLGTLLTKRLDAAWAVGNNQGGRDTGAIADGTWHLWLIRRTDTGVVDAIFSLSATSPTMPTNYTQKRRIGSVIRVSGSLLPFRQVWDEFWLADPIVDVSVSNQSTSSVSRSLTVPTGLRVQAILNIRVLGLNQTSAVYVFSEFASALAPQSPTSGATTTGVVPSVASGAVNSTTTAGASTQMRVFTDASNSVRTIASQANTIVVISTLGWVDNRGKD